VLAFGANPPLPMNRSLLPMLFSRNHRTQLSLTFNAAPHSISRAYHRAYHYFGALGSVEVLSWLGAGKLTPRPGRRNPRDVIPTAAWWATFSLSLLLSEERIGNPEDR
jgi:hypothetical protein